MGNTIMNLLGLGNPTGKEFLRAQTQTNTLLNNMSPEVAGMFQQQFGINPMIDPARATAAATGAANPLLALSAIQGLLSPQETTNVAYGATTSYTRIKHSTTKLSSILWRYIGWQLMKTKNLQV